MNYIIFVNVLILIILFCLIIFLNDNKNNFSRKREGALTILKIPNIETKDCLTEPAPCFSDLDCSIQCSKNFLINCIRQKCQISNDIIKGKCNTQHGIFNILTGDPSISAAYFECISLTLPWIFKNDDTLQENVCEGGKVEINLELEEFKPQHCVCGNGHTLIYYQNNIPHCTDQPELFFEAQTNTQTNTQT